MTTLTEATGEAAARETPARRRRRRVDHLPYLLLLPCLAIIAVLLLWPLGQVVWMSFHKLDSVRQLRGDREWPWVGLANYAQILGDPSSVRCCATRCCSRSPTWRSR